MGKFIGIGGGGSGGGGSIHDTGTTAPTGKTDGHIGGYEISSSGRLYFFANGNRYKINAILDNPGGDALLMEAGDTLLLETGDRLLLE